MDLILSSLRSVATAIVEPTHLIMLVIIGIMFYIKNKRVAIMQKITIGESLDSPLELTLSQIVLGITAGILGSVILTALGVTFHENSGIEFMFMISILLLFFNKKYICFAYSGAILGLLGIISSLVSQVLKQNFYFQINILSIGVFVGVLHILEGLLVAVDGSKGAIPVFTNRNEKIIGGFSLNRFWALPIAIFMIFNGSNITGHTVAIQTPSWWPILDRANLLSILATSVIGFIPFYGILGFNAVTFTKEKKTKAIHSGTNILIYGLSVVLVSQLCYLGIIGQIVTIIYMPVAHEILLRFNRKGEIAEKYLYVSDDDGISILEVAPSSPAFEVGIRRGDKILEINGEKVNNEGDIFKVVKSTIFKIGIKIKNSNGQIHEYFVQPKNKRLGVLLVPKMVKKEDMMGVGTDEFKKILEDLKSKK